MTCKNCGAELTSDVCEYCGTKYNYISKSGDDTYTFEYDGTVYKVRLESINAHNKQDVFWDVNGRLNCIYKKNLTFIFTT